MTAPALRPYQVDHLDRLRADYKRGHRWVIAQAPTGAGKGHQIAEQARRLAHAQQRVLLVTHRRKLVSQLDDRLDLFEVSHGVIMDGYPTTPGPVQVASRDTLYAMMDAGAALPVADWVLIDECHVACDRVLRHYRDARGTGYTGTPCTAEGGGLGRPWQSIVPSVGARPLIDQGVLADVVCYDPEAVGRARQRGEKGRVVGGVIRHWKQYADGLPTLAFAATRAQGRRVCEQYRAAGVPSEYVDGDTPDDDRDRIYDRVESGAVVVLVNVNVMKEGVDIPVLTCCQFLRGVTSFVFYRQGAGRVMRSCPGKGRAVILDHAGATHEFGLPTEDVEWSVDPHYDAAAAARRKARQENNRVVVCQRCGRLYAGAPKCPGCDYQPPKKVPALKDITEQTDGLLTRYEGGDEGARAVAQSSLQRQWLQCLGIAARKGQHFLAAGAMFKRSTGRYPDQCGVEPPMPPWDQRRLSIREVYPGFGGKGG